MQELYQVFGRGVRHYLCRQLGMQDVDDKIHDTFLIVVQAIQKGDLREPDRLMGFVFCVRSHAAWLPPTLTRWFTGAATMLRSIPALRSRISAPRQRRT